jgi:hypothetical protein
MQAIDDENSENQWSGCCSKSDKGFIKYLTQILFGASVCIFSMVQIGRNDVPNKEVYFGLLSGTMGIFMPHPSLKDK